MPPVVPSFHVDDAERPLYTAAQIARAAQRSKRHILASLALVPSTAVPEAGNIAKGWTVESLPASIRQSLETVARKKGYRSVHALLDEPTPRWMPEIKTQDIAPADIQAAEKLRECLRPYLRACSDLDVDLPELKALTLRGYARAFGYDIKERRLLQLVELVNERDRGLEEWDRLEIYLPRIYKAAPAQSKVIEFPVRFEALEIALSSIENESPAPEEIAFIWKAAVDAYLLQSETVEDESKLKKQLADFLRVHAPWIGRSASAILRNLERKIKIAREKGIEELRDHRAEASGNYRRPDFAQDKLLLAKVATFHEGNISLANRLLRKGWTHPNTGEFFKFSSDYLDYISFNPRVDKSKVPDFMRMAVAGPVQSIRPLIYGPRAAKLAAPSRRRDWSDVQPNDWHTSDDETANSFVFVVDPAGAYECEEFRFNVLRPQILPLYDVASEMPLALIVSPTAGYSAETIRSLVVPTWLDPRVGMPFRGCLFERGTWEAQQVQSLVNWAKIDASFARQGISMRLHNATTPRAKTIERIFGVEQDRTSVLPGYIGRGKGDGRYERVDRFLQSLRKAGQPRKENVDPREMLLSLEEFTSRLQEIMRDLSKEPINGSRHRGRSPEEMWDESLSQATVRPRQVLPASLEYLLATKETEVKVSTDGILLTIGRERYQYCASERLGLLVGRKVSVRYAGRVPDHIIVRDPVEDPKGLAPFTVPLRQRIPAMSATREQFKQARAEENLFISQQRALYRLIAPSNNITVQRADLGTESLRAEGEAISAAEREFQKKESKRRELSPKAAELGRRRGLDTTGQDPERVISVLGPIDELRRKILAQEETQTGADE
ncbi:hypothetical protein DB345_17335 [Spartobacteria bacterium LR76]|nr:hypothetical protein DB345_17335 [Spartobacteria bacterium LR76]